MKIFKNTFTLIPALRPFLLYCVELYRFYISNTGVINVKILLNTFIIRAVITVVFLIITFHFCTTLELPIVNPYSYSNILIDSIKRQLLI